MKSATRKKKLHPFYTPFHTKSVVVTLVFDYYRSLRRSVGATVLCDLFLNESDTEFAHLRRSLPVLAPAMSFGFSVGDFLAVGSLINDIVCSLREAGGSKSEHQELVRELESLQQALSHLDKLQLGKSSQTSLESIKYAAYSCRRPLEQFLGKIKKYEKSLGVWSQRSSLKSATDKLRWAFGEKDEIRKLQSYLNVHVGTINILLAEHGLETMDIDSKKAEADQLHVRARFDDTRKVIDWIKSSVSAQALAIQTTQSMLSKLCELVSGESITSWKSFGEMVAKMCVSTQQIYTVVLEIKDSLSLGNTSWTYFQAPLIVEDALGFKFPVPSEYDFELLDTIIKHRFLEGPGSSEVEAGNYELFNTKNSRQVSQPMLVYCQVPISRWPYW